jgi:hypothetical protein
MSSTTSETALMNNMFKQSINGNKTMYGMDSRYNSQALLQPVAMQGAPPVPTDVAYVQRSGAPVDRAEYMNVNKNSSYRLQPNTRNSGATQAQNANAQLQNSGNAPFVAMQQTQQMPPQPLPMHLQQSVQPISQQVVPSVTPPPIGTTFQASNLLPLGNPLVPPNIVDYTLGNMIMPSPNRLIKQTMFLYNNGVNTFPSFSRYILVIGNCDTSSNYQQFVDLDNLAEQYPNQVQPFSYYYQIEKSQLRFECFSSWTWNLDMNVGQNLVTNMPQINIYDEIFIYPHEKLVKTRELTRFNALNTELPTQYTPIFGYSNENDIFILLPDIEICYIGQKFNFYICRKVRNLYNPTCMNFDEDETFTSVPLPYQALLHQYSVNIYIFASDTLNRRNKYISDNNVFDGGLMIGPRVITSDDKSIYYLKLDNETYFNDLQCDCNDEKIFSLNPKNIFDYWKVEISVVTYRNVKRFHVDTALPPYTNNFSTPITMLPTPCADQQDVGLGLFSNGVSV